MNNWKIMKLREILSSLESGNRPKGGVRNNSEGIPSIGGEHLNVDGGFNFRNIKYISEKFYSSLKKGKIKENDILIVKDGATTGKIAFVSLSFPYEKAAVNEHVFILRAKPVIEPKYLFYFLYSSYGQKQILSTFHGAAIGGINTKFVNYVKVPLPPLPVQKRIVSILEKAEKLKERRKKANEETNKIIQSVFYEMFGDPIKNDKGFPVKKLNEICDVRDGTHESPKYVNEGYPLVTSKNVKDGYIDFSDAKLISKEDFDNINRRSLVEDGDIIMPMIGTIGNPIIVKMDREFAIKNVALIKFNKTNISNVYINILLKSPYFYYITKKSNRGGTQKFIALKDIRNIPIPIPPDHLQKQFASIVKKIESMKERQKKSTEDINQLFDALMQKAFKGELS